MHCRSFVLPSTSPLSVAQQVHLAGHQDTVEAQEVSAKRVPCILHSVARPGDACHGGYKIVHLRGTRDSVTFKSTTTLQEALLRTAQGKIQHGSRFDLWYVLRISPGLYLTGPFCRRSRLGTPRVRGAVPGSCRSRRTCILFGDAPIVS